MQIRGSHVEDGGRTRTQIHDRNQIISHAIFLYGACMSCLTARLALG